MHCLIMFMAKIILISQKYLFLANINSAKSNRMIQAQTQLSSEHFGYWKNANQVKFTEAYVMSTEK